VKPAPLKRVTSDELRVTKRETGNREQGTDEGTSEGLRVTKRETGEQANDRQAGNGQTSRLQPGKIEEVKEAMRPSNFKPQPDTAFKGRQLRVVESIAQSPSPPPNPFQAQGNFRHTVETIKTDSVVGADSVPRYDETESLKLNHWADLPDEKTYLPPPPDFEVQMREWQHLQKLEREQRGL
jgi:hypothetical protein